MLEIENHVLGNGLRVKLCRRSGLHRVSVLLNVASGCRDERLPGTAHMLEHMIFRGSRQYPSLRALSEAFEAHGADFNACTAREITSFDVVMPPESFAPVMSLLGEVISEPRLTGIAAERDIIREEIISDYDDENGLICVDDLICELFYGDAGRPIAGDPDDLENINKAEVQAYYAAHYAASNMLLVVTGAFGASEDVIQVLEQAFSALPTHAERWPRRKMPAHYLHAIENPDAARILPQLCLKKHDGSTQSEVVFGFLCPGMRSEGSAALEMLVRILDDGMASRLSRRLVEELALVYDADASLSVTQESVLFQIGASCRHRRVGRLVSAVYDLLAEIVRDGIPDSELMRVKRRLSWEHLALRDGLVSLAEWITAREMNGMSCDMDERCRRLEAVTGDEIQAQARCLLEQRPHIVAIVGNPGPKTQDEIQTAMSSYLSCQIETTIL